MKKKEVESRYLLLRNKYIAQQFYDDDTDDLRVVIEVEWVGARPAGEREWQSPPGLGSMR